MGGTNIEIVGIGQLRHEGATIDTFRFDRVTDLHFVDSDGGATLLLSLSGDAGKCLNFASTALPTWVSLSGRDRSGSQSFRLSTRASGTSMAFALSRPATTALSVTPAT